jgi:hypothetical protein
MLVQVDPVHCSREHPTVGNDPVLDFRKLGLDGRKALAQFREVSIRFRKTPAKLR